MPMINGKFYANPGYGEGMERARKAHDRSEAPMENPDGIGTGRGEAPKENKQHRIPDPGPDRYDRKHEQMVREMITQHAAYAEDGPTCDPDGNYLCGTCNMREEPTACTVVAGFIDMEEMGCRRWAGGKLMPVEMGEKSDPELVGLSQVSSGGFGCERCEYASKAEAPDEDGRPLWCGDWGTHVRPTACCEEQDQEGLVEIESEEEQAEQEDTEEGA